METLIVAPFADIFAGARVLVTGHTGFKGAWLTMWLLRLGAEVTGYALPPATEPNLFTLAGLERRMTHIAGDIRDRAHVEHLIRDIQPHVIFHLAARAIVLESYQQPAETFDVNVMGTVAVLEALRQTGTACSVVCVSSDKCYENRGWVYGYRETDTLGGHDPYSASKAAMEIAITAYRASYFANSGTRVASARAGNVIGGGDWAAHRLVPDAVRAFAAGEPLAVRHPNATRPWQHVLEPLSGYLTLAARLQDAGGDRFASAYNFGPVDATDPTVAELVSHLASGWADAFWIDTSTPHAPHEAARLSLSIDRARHDLGWQPRWTIEAAAARTVARYQAMLSALDAPPSAARQDAIYEGCLEDIDVYLLTMRGVRG